VANLTTNKQLFYKGVPLPEGVYFTPSGRMRKKTPHSSHEYTYGVCAWCENEFIGPEPNKNWKKRYCSRRCSRTSRRVNKDGFSIDTAGYACQDSKRIHIQVAEKALGRNLKKGEVVHHINMDKTDYRNTNLLICSASYHKQLHGRYEMAFARSLEIE
jgi:hypothetical protein